MSRKCKTIAWILAIAVFFAMMLSVNVIVHDAGHECVGQDCQVCLQMESAWRNLKMLASVILAIAFAIVLVYTGHQWIGCSAQPLLQGSLVTLKVELLN